MAWKRHDRIEQPPGVKIPFLDNAYLVFNCEGILTGYFHAKEVTVLPQRLARVEAHGTELHLIFECSEPVT